MSDFLKRSIDLIDEGLIVIDSRGKIKVYNREAATIFGIDPRIGPGHKAGKIKDRDIVILADNCLGKDDGNLSPADLKALGVDSKEIDRGESLVLIGKKDAPPGTAYYKSSGKRDETLVLQKQIEGLDLKAEINFEDKLLNIEIDQESYPFYYSFAAGNIVIIDPEASKVKFYQARGYTARKEDVRSILKGKKYISKGPRGQKPDLIDKHISSYHPDAEIINRLLDVANQKGEEIKNRESIINGVPTRCTITSIKKDGDVIGAMLKVEDIRELKYVIEERDKALNSIQYLETRLQHREKQSKSFENLLGISEKFNEAKQMAYKASESISNVLLLGPSGTGKNMFARAIHKASARQDGPFVYINCASIPENLFESELFGYEKGSFTGALSTGKMGKLEKADKGTLFLDEIAELPLSLQAKLLHFLQSRTFTRVGGLEEKEVDVRLIFATNRDLEKMVKEERFREDLYFRINVLPIILPALRERREDIPILARTLIIRICKKIGKKPKKISPEALEFLIAYDWKGNIRELENVLERAVNIGEGEMVRPEDLPQKIINNKVSSELVDILRVGPLRDAVYQTEEKIIRKALEYTGGSRKKAIKLLGIGKTAFYDKLKKYDIK